MKGLAFFAIFFVLPSVSAAAIPVANSQALLVVEGVLAQEVPPNNAGRDGRVDFDDRLVQGQGNSRGQISLFLRRPLKLQSLVSRERSFRQRIVDHVFWGVRP